MNPVVPTIVNRSAKALTASLIVQVTYRILTRKTLTMAQFVALNSLLAAALSIDLTTTFYGPSRLGFPSLYTKIPGAGRRVALTFDDGPEPESTGKILDILASAAAPATFFCLGESAGRFPELIEMIDHYGQKMAFHGYVHKPMSLQSAVSVQRDIVRTRALLSESALPYLRPPYGIKTWHVQKACRLEKLHLTTWSLDPRDYDEPQPGELIRRVVERLHDGAVILLHEWPKSTRQALPYLVDRIRSAGYELIHLPGDCSGYQDLRSS